MPNDGKSGSLWRRLFGKHREPSSEEVPGLVSQDRADVEWAPDSDQISEMRAANHAFYAQYYSKIRFLSLRYEYIYRRHLLEHKLADMNVPARRLTVLDMGFGHGDLLFLFDTSCALHGLELSPSAVEMARNRAQQSGYENAAFTEHDLHELIPYPDGLFDVVICSHVLEHIGNDTAVLDDIHRVLKPDGCAFLFIPIHDVMSYSKGSKHIRKYTSDGFRQTVENCGFRVVHALEHQFFDRVFKAFATSRNRYDFDVFRRAVQYTIGFLIVMVHPLACMVDRFLGKMGAPASCLLLVLKKGTTAPSP